ncbi:hypothetical protein RI054_09g46830 [Pseudoscourfieldia marina]
MKIPGMVIPTYLELKRQSRTTMRQIAPSTSEDERRKAQGAQEENRTPKPKISPHAALATAAAAEVRRPSRKTRHRSLRMKGFLNSSVHSVQQRGQITIEHTTGCPNPRPGGGRGRGGRGAAGGRGRGYGRGYTQYGQIDIKDVECFKCGQLGHYANKCPNPPKDGNPTSILKKQVAFLTDKLEDRNDVH